MTLKGKWRIVEMALWDLDFLDMMEPAYIFSTTKPGASSPSAASPAKSTAARPRLHLYRPTLADFFNSLLVSLAVKGGPAPCYHRRPVSVYAYAALSWVTSRGLCQGEEGGHSLV